MNSYMVLIFFSQNVFVNKVNKSKTTADSVRHKLRMFTMGGTVARLSEFFQTTGATDL